MPNPLTKSKDVDVPWSSIADLMSGLMVTFLFISIAYMSRVQTHTRLFYDLKDQLVSDIRGEFEKDLAKWNAEFDPKNLVIRFRQSDMLFEQGQAAVNPAFRQILSDFFPRYIRLLYSAKDESGAPAYRNQIDEIRIEGHTSSEWRELVSVEDAYKKNMILSQERARNVLFHILNLLPTISPDSSKNPALSQADFFKWARKRFVANGLSSSHPIESSSGAEDRDRSRRVDFRVQLSPQAFIDEIARQ
jgi:outer membrane protein OmpA-like peptidoglycan-associated protein